MSDIVDVAKRAKEIVAFDSVVYCGKCNSKQFSPFDKLFVSAYDICVMCHPDGDEFLRKGKNIFTIVESEL
jgi:hypothetical protein